MVNEQYFYGTSSYARVRTAANIDPCRVQRAGSRLRDLPPFDVAMPHDDPDVPAAFDLIKINRLKVNAIGLVIHVYGNSMTIRARPTHVVIRLSEIANRDDLSYSLMFFNKETITLV